MLTSEQAVRCAVVGAHGLIERITTVEAHVLSDLGAAYVPNVPEYVDDLTHRWDVLRGAFVALPPRPDAPHYWKNGGWKVYPPQPHHSATWDEATEQWIDHRTQADHQAALYAARKARDLSFREFLFACNEYDLLSDSDMMEAAQRQIPASFAEAMAGLDPKLQMQIRVTWASLTTVNRMDPLLLLVAYAKDISDDLLDKIFGIVTPT